MPNEADHLVDNFFHEFGREAIAVAFQRAAKCLENQDYSGYELHFQIYVRLARGSGMASTLSNWHESVSQTAVTNA